MSLGCLPRDEVSEKDLAAEIIDGSDDGPSLLCKRRPNVKRSVMLYQGTDGSGQDFPVVHLSLPAWFMAAKLLGPFDDSGDGNIDPFLP